MEPTRPVGKATRLAAKPTRSAAKTTRFATKPTRPALERSRSGRKTTRGVGKTVHFSRKPARFALKTTRSAVKPTRFGVKTTGFVAKTTGLAGKPTRFGVKTTRFGVKTRTCREANPLCRRSLWLCPRSGSRPIRTQRPRLREHAFHGLLLRLRWWWFRRRRWRRCGPRALGGGDFRVARRRSATHGEKRKATPMENGHSLGSASIPRRFGNRRSQRASGFGLRACGRTEERKCGSAEVRKCQCVFCGGGKVELRGAEGLGILRFGKRRLIHARGARARRCAQGGAL